MKRQTGLVRCRFPGMASVEAPVVEMMDQPEDSANSPAAGEELSAADEAGEADAAAPDTEATVGDTPAAQAPATEVPAASGD